MVTSLRALKHLLIKSQSLCPTRGLFSGGSIFLTVSVFTLSVLLLPKVSVMYLHLFFLLSTSDNFYFLLSMKDEDLVQVHELLSLPPNIWCILKSSWTSSSTAHIQVVLSHFSSHPRCFPQLHKVRRVWVFPFIFSFCLCFPLSLYPWCSLFPISYAAAT